jgi:bifunctional oligoribonuclease and PAP phosphatase NrnA
VTKLFERFEEAHECEKEGIAARILHEMEGPAVQADCTQSDFDKQSGAEDSTTGVDGPIERIVDHMRAVEGTAVAVLVRELLSEDRDGMRKVSLRATDRRVDVSRVAREFGGGGHPQAAGFSTSLPLDQLVERLRALVGGQLPSV